MAIKKIVTIDAVSGRAIGYDTDTGDIVFLDGDTVTGRVDGTGIDMSTFAIDNEAQGDIMRRGASGWERLAAATSGQILVGDGTDIDSVAVSGDATLSAAGALTIANDAVTSAKTAADLVQTATKDLTASEVQNLAGTPIEIIADSVVGADQILNVHSITYVLNAGGTPYDDAAADGDLVLEYSGGVNIDTFEADGFIDSASDLVMLINSIGDITPATVGEGLQLTNDGAEFTTGDGTLRVIVRYSLQDLGL